MPPLFSGQRIIVQGRAQEEERDDTKHLKTKLGGETKIRIGTRKLPLLLATIMMLFVGAGYAIPQGGTTITNIQSLNGIVVRITNAFTLGSVFLEPAIFSLPATPTSCTWSSGGCSTATVAGDWTLAVGIILNTPPSTTTTYTLEIAAATVTGLTSAPSIQFSVPSGTAAGTSLTLTVDYGTTTVPANFELTIAVI